MLNVNEQGTCVTTPGVPIFYIFPAENTLREFPFSIIFTAETTVSIVSSGPSWLTELSRFYQGAMLTVYNVILAAQLFHQHFISIKR